MLSNRENKQIRKKFTPGAMYRWPLGNEVALGLISRSHYYEANNHPHPTQCAGSEHFKYLFFLYFIKN